MSDGERLQVEIALLEELVACFLEREVFDQAGIIEDLEAKLIVKREYLRAFC